MRQVRLWGGLPTTIAEDSGPGDWIANLTITGEITGLLSVEAIGPGASFFSAGYDPTLGLVSLAPAARVDYEALAATAGGQPPELAFSLRLTFADGTRQDDTAVFRVEVLDRDDTAPTALRFAAGGAVTAGEVGSIIGTLAVEDPDSAGPFLFTFAEEDAWRFEVVGGNTLKLRDGISLGLDDMPHRPLLIQVSDGFQSAAFTLDLTVRDPGAGLAVAPILVPGETRVGFTHTGADQVLTLAGAETVAAVNTYGGEVRQVVLAGGGEVWLDGVRRLQFADGRLDLDPDGAAAQAASLHRALFGHAATGGELALHVAQLEAGMAWVDLAKVLAEESGLAALGNADYLTALHRAACGADPGAEELALGLGRLASGTSRAQLAVDIALGATALARLAEENPEGIWIARSFGGEVATGAHETAGTPAASAPESGTDTAAVVPDLGWLL